jgi:hypothetical protein
LRHNEGLRIKPKWSTFCTTDGLCIMHDEMGNAHKVDGNLKADGKMTPRRRVVH